MGAFVLQATTVATTPIVSYRAIVLLRLTYLDLFCLCHYMWCPLWEIQGAHQHIKGTEKPCNTVTCFTEFHPLPIPKQATSIKHSMELLY